MPVVVRGAFHLASDVIETIPAAYDGQAWSKAHKQFIPAALTSVATLKKHALIHSLATPMVLAPRPLQMLI